MSGGDESRETLPLYVLDQKGVTWWWQRKRVHSYSSRAKGVWMVD